MFLGRKGHLDCEVKVRLSSAWGRQPGCHRPLHLGSCLLPTALKGAWQSGFFDQGSFTEIMAPWAQTVVTGRAR